MDRRIFLAGLVNQLHAKLLLPGTAGQREFSLFYPLKVYKALTTQSFNLKISKFNPCQGCIYDILRKF